MGLDSEPVHHEQYLVYSPDIQLPGYQEMIAEKQTLPVVELLAHLNAARDVLLQPGPNLYRRKSGLPQWLDWWIEYLGKNQFDEQIAGNKLLTNAEVAARNLALSKKGSYSGVSFGNGYEGTEAHRHFINWMINYSGPKIETGIFIDSKYYPGPDKIRGNHFLPLSIRLSMWALYRNRIGGLDYISVIPEREGDLAEFYDTFFNRTLATLYFVSNNDPHFKNKKVRNPAWAPPWVVVHSFDTRRTTDRVQKLNAKMKGKLLLKEKHC